MKPSDPDTDPDTDLAKTKALFLLPTLDAGGAERMLLTFLNNVDRTRFDPHFVVINNHGPMGAWIADDIRVHSLDCTSIKGAIIPLMRLVSHLKPDVIFTTMVHSNGLALLMKIRFPHIRVIVREAALPSSIVKNYGYKGRLCWLIYKLLYPRADVVISNSSQVLAEFSEYIKIPTHNHAVVFNPVDTERLNLTAQPKARGEGDPIRFACVGRLVFEKGYDRLIAALGAVQSSRAWHLDIVGGGPERPKLESLIAQHGLGDNITLHGHLSAPWEIAGQADCLLLPSRWEGMPNVVLEGLACGLPAIVMREAGGVVDIADHAADVQLVDTIEDMAHAVEHFTPKAAPSLLPEAFQIPTVMNAFEALLLPQENRAAPSLSRAAE